MEIRLKRFLSLALVIVMVIGMMPTNIVFAEENPDVPGGEEQVENTIDPTIEPVPTEPEETSAPTQAPTEAPTEPEVTESVTEVPTESEATEEPLKPVCTGLADCAAENHEDTCEKKTADDKAAADKAAADAVAALITALPTLEQLQAMPLEEQTPYYNQVYSAYGAYCALTADQQALLPPADEVFKPYFDYFATLTEETDLIAEGTCGDNLTWVLDAEGTLTISGTGEMYNDPWYEYNSEIKRVVIEYGATSISYGAFGHLQNLTSIVIPDSVTAIGNWAFANCHNLGSVVIPNGVTDIGEYAFTGCSALTEINIPSGVTSIDVKAFSQCYNLARFAVDSDNPTFSNDDVGALLDKNKSTLLYVPGGVGSKYQVPESVTSVGTRAFSDCYRVSIYFLKDAPVFAEDAFTSHMRIYYPAGNETWMEAVRQDYGKSVTWIAHGNEGKCGNNLTWSFDENTGTLTISGTGEMYDYTSRGTPWDGHLKDIRSLAIGDGVTSLGNHAFGWCESLTAVKLPESVKNFGDNAFNGCINLTTINIPDGVTHISKELFGECGKLTGVKIPDSVTSIGFGAFVGCESLTEINLPDGLKSIGDCAFYNCHGLMSVIIPASLTFMGGEAFFDCPITDVYISDLTAWLNLTHEWDEDHFAEFGFRPYGKNLYLNGKLLTDVVIPDGVTKIGESAFSGYEHIRSVKIPDSVTEIDWFAFSGCKNLTYVDVPASVSTINTYAFNDIEHLRIVIRNPNVNINGEWGGKDFGDPHSTIIFGAEGSTAEAYAKENGYRFSTLDGKCGDNLTWTFEPQTGILTISGSGKMDNYDGDGLRAPWYPCQNDIKKIVVEEGVTSLGSFAFIGCEESVVEVILPNTLVEIGESAFEFATALEAMDIPDSVTVIGPSAFYACESLKSIVIGDNVESLGNGAFTLCHSLENVVLGTGIASVGTDTFWDCTALKEIVIPANVKSVESGAFGISALNTIIFEGDAPAFAADAFEGVTTTAYYPFENPTWTAAVMKDYGGDITWVPYSGMEGKCGENLTWKFDDETGTLTISGTGEMDNYTEPSLENIPWAPFASRVQKLVVEEGVTSIGEWAFIKCLNIKELILPSTLTTIGGYSFYGNEVIEELILPEGLKHIGEAAFEFCTKLKTVVIPESLESSGYAPFWCAYPETVVAGNLTPGLLAYCQYGRVTLGDNITTIPEQAFIDGRLGEITIPASVKVIEKQAFYLCGKGNKIIFQGNAPQIAENAFEETSATIYYPAGNETWTEDVRQNYGGTITWVALANEGKCGENLTWKFDNATGTLSISGTGRMYDNDWYEPTLPWYPLQDEIKKIVVEEGVTALGKCAFYQSEAVTEVSLPSTLVVIGESAFEFCEALEIIDIPKSVEIIGPSAFYMCKNLDSIILPNNVTSLGGGAFWGCGSLTEVVLSKSLETIEAESFVDCVSLREIVIPESIKSIQANTFLVSGLNTITFMGDAPVIAADAFEGLKVNAIYPAGNATWTEKVRQNYGGTITWLDEGLDGNDITLKQEEWGGVSTVWVNGVAYPVITEDGQTKVQIPEGVAVEEGTSMVTYNFHVGDANDRHTQYPTGMQVWILQENEQGELVPTRVEELDDILQYSGSSIRITGKRGIRMITSIQQSKKNALVRAGLAEYKLLEYGTALCWAKDLAGGTDLNLEQAYVKSNYAYKRGVADPVFKYAGDLMQYTNVLVGFSMDECKDDIAMRPYMILEGPNGEQVTIYGGIIYRSIGYIAYQNRNAFTVGSDAYNYVWEIIHHVYGDQYDADYKG